MIMRSTIVFLFFFFYVEEIYSSIIPKTYTIICDINVKMYLTRYFFFFTGDFKSSLEWAIDCDYN